MTHTPGPWNAVNLNGKDSDLAFFEVVGPQGELIAQVHGNRQPTVRADARLIAAAPALLEALEAVTNELHKLANGNGPVRGLTLGQVKTDIRVLRDVGRGAIALAKGEEVTA